MRVVYLIAVIAGGLLCVLTGLLSQFREAATGVSLIAYVGYDVPARDWGLYAMPPEGTPRRYLARLDAPPDMGRPAWSADGSRLYFVRYDQIDQQLRLYTRGLWGHTESEIPLDVAPAFPELGRLHMDILFSGEANIYRTGESGGAVTPLLPAGDNVAWAPYGAPDGESVVFVGTPGVFKRGAVCILPLDSREMTCPELPDEIVGGNYMPVWSPDGEWIAFHARLPQSGFSGIYRMRPDGSDLRLLSPESFDAYTPAWSPDGAWLMFQRVDRGQRQLYRMRVNGDDLHRIPTPQAVYAAAWSPRINRDWHMVRVLLIGLALIGGGVGMLYRIS